MLVLLHSACCMRLKTAVRVLPLDAVSLRWQTWSGCQLSPRCPLVLNQGGMGLVHLWGPFAFFAVVRGDDGDLPETSASSRARFCPAHYCEKCNEQLCSRLAQRTSNCGQRTTWGQMAASWKRTRLDKQQVAVSSSNTAVEDLARCSSDMHERAVRGRARTPRGRAYTSEYWRRAARWLLIGHVMSAASARARGVRACVPYCRTALYGLETANRDNVLVCES